MVESRNGQPVNSREVREKQTIASANRGQVGFAPILKEEYKTYNFEMELKSINPMENTVKPKVNVPVFAKNKPS